MIRLSIVCQRLNQTSLTRLARARHPLQQSWRGKSWPLGQFLNSQDFVQLKWPNDVLVGGKKISGILLEMGQGYLVVGMGLNVRHHPENALYPVTSLAAEGADTSPLAHILDILLKHLGYWHEIMLRQGFEPIRKAWLSHARQGETHVRLPAGNIHGIFAGLDIDGNLRLTLPDGTEQVIIAGDVFFQ